MVKSHVILGAIWILFCVLHSIFASSAFKQFVKDRTPGQYKLYRLYYTLFAFISFATVMVYLFTMNSYKLFVSTGGTLIAGSLLVGFGVIVMTICIIKYFMQLSGLKGLIEKKPNNELMITGIHKMVRHPLYAGTFVFIWGLLLLFPYLSLFIADTIITIYTLIGLRFEEKKLEKEFGESYKLYKQKVPMIIPRFRG